MNFGELQREVKTIVQDASAEILVSIPDFINEAYLQICEEVKPPSLKVIFSVSLSTSVAWINMPTVFSGKLTYVGNSDGKIDVLDNLEDLVELYPSMTETGDVECVFLQGNVLWYQKIPTVATSLICIGYNSPVVLLNETDEPSEIPTQLQRGLLVNKAAGLAYNIIEDVSIDKDKVNTRLFASLYEIERMKMLNWVSSRRSNITTSCMSV
jgi:hypothetical protein